MGDACSSRGFPSLAVVVDLFLLKPGRNLDCFDGLDSVLGVGSPSGPSVVWLALLLMRKKFLNFVAAGVCVPDWSPLLCCFFEENDRLEKFRLSVAILQRTNRMDPQEKSMGEEWVGG